MATETDDNNLVEPASTLAGIPNILYTQDEQTTKVELLEKRGDEILNEPHDKTRDDDHVTNAEQEEKILLDSAENIDNIQINKTENKVELVEKQGLTLKTTNEKEMTEPSNNNNAPVDVTTNR